MTMSKPMAPIPIPTYSPHSLAQAIKHYRVSQNKTQLEVGEPFCLLQKTISGFENHPEGTKLSTLFAIVSSLDLMLFVVPKGHRVIVSDPE